MTKLNLKDRDILLPVNGISLKLDGGASVQDLLRALNGVTVVLYIGDGDGAIQIPLKQIPTGELPEFKGYKERLKYPV